MHCFVLDCSASMLRQDRLARAKGLLLSLFNQAAHRRAQVALICFGGSQASLRFGPAVPRWWNERWLAPLGGGGGTPLGLGLASAAQQLARSARLAPAQQRWLWVLTDARSTEAPPRPQWADEMLLVDFDDLGGGRGAELARLWGAQWVRAD